MTHISGTQGHRSEQLGSDKEELNQPNLFGKTLKYPSDLENANGHYMIFNVHTRADRHKANDAVDLNISTDSLQTFNTTFTRERFFDDTTGGPFDSVYGVPVKMIKDTIVLYMPTGATVTFKSRYSPAAIGLAVGALAAAGDFAKGTKGGWGDYVDFFKGISRQAVSAIEPLVQFATLGTGTGIGAALQRKSGYGVAPMQEMIFEGIDFRTFEYSFTFNPRNREEAQDVKKIIDTFTYHMLPEKVGYGAALAYRVPSEFTIRYMYRGHDNNYLNHLTYCALDNLKVDYGGDEKYVTYRPDDTGAPPVTTKITLSFQELELVDKRRIQAVEGTHTTTTRKFTPKRLVGPF